MNTFYVQGGSVLRRHMVALIGISLCFYFTYHTLQGSRSVPRLVAVNSSIATMSQKNDSLRLEREILEKKVASMRPGQVDKDLLDEKVRLNLGFKRADEFLVVGN